MVPVIEWALFTYLVHVCMYVSLNRDITCMIRDLEELEPQTKVI